MESEFRFPGQSDPVERADQEVSDAQPGEVISSDSIQITNKGIGTESDQILSDLLDRAALEQPDSDPIALCHGRDLCQERGT